MPTALVLLVAIAIGCRSPQPAEPTIGRDTFVTVVVALRQAADTLTDVDAFSAERDRILAEAGVTDSALIEFVRVHGATPGRMAVIWDSIAARLVDEEAEAR